MKNIGVLPPKKNAIVEIFDKDKAIIGMIHTKALPGAPRYKGESMDEIIEFSLKDALSLKEGGVDGLMFENGWDIPFTRGEDIGQETVAAMAILAKEITREVNLPFGFTILENGAEAGLAAAKASSGNFVRSNQWVNAYISNAGLTEGASSNAMRYKSKLKADDVKILADVHVKHGSHSIVSDRSLAEQTRDNVFYDADILIATGDRTGDETPVEELRGIVDHTDLPVIVGSGLSHENAGELMEYASGAIVGSHIKEDGVWWNPVSVERTKRLMDIVNKYR